MTTRTHWPSTTVKTSWDFTTVGTYLALTTFRTSGLSKTQMQKRKCKTPLQNTFAEHHLLKTTANQHLHLQNTNSKTKVAWVYFCNICGTPRSRSDLSYDFARPRNYPPALFAEHQENALSLRFADTPRRANGNEKNYWEPLQSATIIGEQLTSWSKNEYISENSRTIQIWSQEWTIPMPRPDNLGKRNLRRFASEPLFLIGFVFLICSGG